MPPTPVKLARVQLGMTQLDTGRRARILPGRLSLIERNLVEARADEKARIARVLQVDVAKLFPSIDRENTAPTGDAARASNAE